jgi:hypothetical protein
LFWRCWRYPRPGLHIPESKRLEDLFDLPAIALETLSRA